MFDNSYRQVRSIVDKPRNIILGHFRKLFLEDAFQAREDDKAVVRPIIIHHAKLNISSALLENSRLKVIMSVLSLGP